MNNKKRPHLVSVKTILIILAVSCFSLYALFPHTLFFEDDSLSQDYTFEKTYLNAALITDPYNEKLRAKKIAIHIGLNEYSQATSELKKLPKSDKKTELEIKLLYALWVDSGAKKDDRFEELTLKLSAFTHWDEQLLEIAKATGLNTSVAQYYERYAQPLLAADFWLSAGEPAKALAIYKTHINADVAQKAIETALGANNPKQAYRWWKKYGDTANSERTLYYASLAGDDVAALKAVEILLKAQPNNSEYLTKAMHLRLANGDAPGAEQLIAKLLRKTPNNKSLRLLNWKIMRWQNKPKQALKEFKWLMAHKAVDVAMLTDSINDANALYLYQDANDIYEYKAQNRQLKGNGFANWMQTNEFIGNAKQELNHIERYEQINGKTPLSQYWKAKVLHDTGNLAGLRALWPHYAGPKNEEDLLWLARAHWLNDDFTTALTILKQKTHSNDDEFWSARVDMAMRVNDKQEELYALEQLKNITPLSVGDMLHYQQLKFADNPQGLLNYLWQQAPLTDRQLIQITLLSTQIGDEEHVTRAHQALEKQRYNKALYPAWLILSNWYQNQSDLNYAYTTLNRAAKLSEYNPDVVLTQGWLALQMHDTIMIKRILANYSSNEPNRDWAQLLASLSIHQKAFNSAYFYLRQLAVSNPRDLTTLVNLADVMNQLGYYANASELKHYLLNHLPKDKYAYRGLMIQWAGAMAVPHLRQFSSLDDIAPEAINNTTANWWLARRAAQKLEPWQKLQLAMSNGEFNKVKALVNTQTLGKVDELSALLYLKQPYATMQRWYEELTQEPTLAETSLLRNARTSYFRALEINLSPEAGLNTSQYDVNVYFPYAKGQWKLSISNQQNLNNNGLLFAIEDKMTWGRWYFDAKVDSHQGKLMSRQGLSLDTRYQWDSRTQVGLKLEHNVENRQSETLLSFAKLNKTTAYINYAIDGRQNVQLSAAAMAFKRRSDSSTLVKGQEYNARYQYTILKDRPIWNTYFSAQWQDFERTLAPLGVDQRARPQLIDIQPFRRFALGTSLSSNTNLAPPYLGESPSWLFDISTGYQTLNDTLDVSVSSGAGWSVLGDDLFKLQLGYQSSNKVGNSDTQLQLGYYVHF
ncbi:protein PelB [Pseudoalteromonas sp. S3776]|uniref:tetratricopeptide repeat protein n=1 Tax=unclassified Pseudoalteromonas TaxID=194690 RepID=UPI001109F7FC|nr:MULTISPECIES: tetratricopeptide repeat protein [unclassified Pseudoalteromonas]TMO74668.1 protein PelB [Pseudoalteromonas sp. S3785]TMO78866.1 protein PelB [Pseudoalteromonas sp. S3776]